MARAALHILRYSQPHPSQTSVNWEAGLNRAVSSLHAAHPERLRKAMPPRGAGFHPVLNLPVGSERNFFLFLCQAGGKKNQKKPLKLCCCLYWMGLKFSIFVIFRCLSDTHYT